MPIREEFGDVREAIKGAAEVTGITTVWPDELPEPGKVTARVAEEIRRAHLCICDLTGRNPNVVWELGFAQCLGKNCLILAQSPKDLFFDVKDERTILYNRADLTRVGAALRQALAACSARAQRIPVEDLVGTMGHEGLATVVAARTIADSAFGFLNLVETAREHIFLAAQNHGYWAETPKRQLEFRSAVEKFLRHDRARHIDIMLCDNSHAARYAIRAWETVVGTRYAMDLDRATSFFREIANWAGGDDDLAGRITIKTVTLVPVSVTFIDPDLSDGVLVLVPNTFESRSRNRPCYVLSRNKNPEVFQSYWGHYSHKWCDDSDAKLLEPAERPDGGH